MHWTQTIRENLKLTQHELAGYLQLSVHTVQAMEQGRRTLPFRSMRACITLYNAMKAGRAHPAHDLLPEADPRMQRKLTGLYRRCRHRLVLYREKLQKMQEEYESARRSLQAYQLLADSLAPSNSPDDVVRRKWTEWQIAETLHRMKENNATAQGLLRVEIAALESRTKALESMMITDSADQEKESVAYHQPDTGNDVQRARGEEEIAPNSNAKTPQVRMHPCMHLGEPLRRVEPAHTKCQTDDSGQMDSGLKPVKCADGTDTGCGSGEPTVDTSFKTETGFPGEPPRGYNKMHNRAGNSLGELTPLPAYSGRIDQRAKPHNRAGNKEPVNSGAFQLTRCFKIVGQCQRNADEGLSTSGACAEDLRPSQFLRRLRSVLRNI